MTRDVSTRTALLLLLFISLKNIHNQLVGLRYSHDLYIINSGDNDHFYLVRDRTSL